MTNISSLPFAPSGRVTYAVVNGSGKITQQGYSTEEAFPTLVPPEGHYVYRTTGILNPERFEIDLPGELEAEWVAIAPADEIFGTEIDVDDAGEVTLAVAPGTTVRTKDGVTHSESGGTVTVSFPERGEQFVRVEQPGRTYRSQRLSVNFLGDIRAIAKKEIDAARNERLFAPLTIGNITLDGDPDAQNNITEAAIFLTLMGTPGQTMDWITADNTIVSLNAAQLQQFASLIATRRASEYQAARNAKDVVMTAQSRGAAQSARDAYTSP